MRVCSFLPAATEIIYSLNLQRDLYGVTHECDWPPQARKKDIVVKSMVDSNKLSSVEIDKIVNEHFGNGHGIYAIDIPRLKEAKPDLILAQELCSVCAISPDDFREALSKLSKRPQVISLDPHSLENVLDDILLIGKTVKKSKQAKKMVDGLKARLHRIRKEVKAIKSPNSVVCIEWLEPFFRSGHWVPQMVEIAGGVDALGNKYADSTRMEWKEIIKYNPEIIVLMPCGFKIERTLKEIKKVQKENHWTQLMAVRNKNVYVVDAPSYFNRPGPRLVDGVELLAEIFHPNIFKGIAPKNSYVRLK